MVFTPVDPQDGEPRRRRFRGIPIRLLLPNMITLLSLCAGLTAIRLALEGRIEWALGAIVFAAVLDGVDGRVARLLKGQSRFGAELDSLADFVNFGVVPGLILYFWGLNELGAIGWIAALVFAICMSLRLARFNVMADDPNRPAWASNFFTGVPAPAGAIIVLLPIYVSLLGMPRVPALACIYTLVLAFLLVSTLPVWSGKKLGTRVAPNMVLPVFVVVVLFVALLVSYPWHVLTAGSLLFIASLPLGWWSYRQYMRRDAEAAAAAKAAHPAVRPQANPSPLPSGLPKTEEDDRPSRLN
ncbi:CDP-diacylglycerol--serine O-phosphatidyltransferase [Pseudorhodoplanes sp.]|uniref:CDP-diacylglycerol--serine O-phosphatidyltransferase n=1 Tax=Pseudorhodoplanes sp. TaxID=1934341 RepID=UPI002C315914|nr:CDP-diacylglycerol--serine O-phosphatidyltransferase [Pseudorhodoplanes sp.]HWV53879.1 CDP-diacylglycerol--serine O-phosphatidyltransferase [Pseudorhodoplanes sp.]